MYIKNIINAWKVTFNFDHKFCIIWPIMPFIGTHLLRKIFEARSLSQRLPSRICIDCVVWNLSSSVCQLILQRDRSEKYESYLMRRRLFFIFVHFNG